MAQQDCHRMAAAADALFEKGMASIHLAPNGATSMHVTTGPEPVTWGVGSRRLTVKELKLEITRRGGRFDDCVERKDLQDRLASLPPKKPV